MPLHNMFESDDEGSLGSLGMLESLCSDPQLFHLLNGGGGAAVAAGAGGGGGGGGGGGSRAPTPVSQFLLESLRRGTPDYLLSVGGGGAAAAAGGGVSGSGSGGAAVAAGGAAQQMGPPPTAAAAAAAAAAGERAGGESGSAGQTAADVLAASQLYNNVFQVWEGVGVGVEYAGSVGGMRGVWRLPITWLPVPVSHHSLSFSLPRAISSHSPWSCFCMPRATPSRSQCAALMLSPARASPSPSTECASAGEGGCGLRDGGEPQQRQRERGRRYRLQQC